MLAGEENKKGVWSWESIWKPAALLGSAIASPFVNNKNQGKTMLDKLKTAEENACGLHQKYVISRADGKPVDADAVYFVLRLDGDHLHNKASRRAAMQWALEVLVNPDGPLTQTATELMEMLRVGSERWTIEDGPPNQPGSEVGEDLKALALSLGYAWPEDEVGRWRCLKTMASRASHWRAETEKYSTELRRNVEKEKLYAHQQRRLQAMTAKVSNLRKALKQFMSLQMALMREYMASVQPKK